MRFTKFSLIFFITISGVLALYFTCCGSCNTHKVISGEHLRYEVGTMSPEGILAQNPTDPKGFVVNTIHQLPVGIYEISLYHSVTNDESYSIGGFWAIYNKKIWAQSMIKGHQNSSSKIFLIILSEHAMKPIVLKARYFGVGKLVIHRLEIKSSIFNYFGLWWVFISGIIAVLYLRYSKLEAYATVWISLSILLILWTPHLTVSNPFSKYLDSPTFIFNIHYLLVPIVAFMIFLQSYKKRNIGDLGLGYKNFVPTCKYLFTPSLFGVISLVFVGLYNSSNNYSFEFWRRAVWICNYSEDFWIILLSIAFSVFFITLWWGYKNNCPNLWLYTLLLIFFPLNALGQQLLIQCFFHQQITKYCGKTLTTTIIVTSYFILVHIPNIPLMLATGYIMFFWARSYQKFPNIYAISLFHHVLSLVMKFSLPQYIISNRHVGYLFMEKSGWNWFVF